MSGTSPPSRSPKKPRREDFALMKGGQPNMEESQRRAIVAAMDEARVRVLRRFEKP